MGAMPTIVFDCLVPRAEAEALEGRFRTLLDTLIDAGRLTEASLTSAPASVLAEGVEEQLHTIYRSEHDGQDMDDAVVQRYDIAVDGVTGSVNELTMTLSRLLTPAAQFDVDRALLGEIEELPATYPWTVMVLP